QAVSRDLLGPGEAVVEDVTREKLQKDDESERPEDHEVKRACRIVVGHTLVAFRLDEALLALELLFFAHAPRPSDRNRHARVHCGMTGSCARLLPRLPRVALGLRRASTR